MTTRQTASEPLPASDLFAGVWLVTDQAEEQMEIEIYNHPERGLCVWFDYAPGNSTIFSGNGHVPVHASGLTFVRPANEKAQQPRERQ